MARRSSNKRKTDITHGLPFSHETEGRERLSCHISRVCGSSRATGQHVLSKDLSVMLINLPEDYR